MSKKQKVAIIVPTYNEKENVTLLVAAIFKHQPSASIFIVDDNSPDGTSKIVNKLQSKHPNLYLISNSNKSGRGAAVIQGFKEAYQLGKYDFFVEMDADFSHQPNELNDLINNVEDDTFVVSSRYMLGGRTINWPFYRKIFSHLANRMLRMILGITLTDYTNGFRAYSRQAIKILCSRDYISSSYYALTETAIVLNQSGFNVREVPGIFPNRTRGKSNTGLNELKNNVVDLYKLKRSLRRESS